LKKELLSLRSALCSIKKGANMRQHIYHNACRVKNNISNQSTKHFVPEVVGKVNSAPKKLIRKKNNLSRM